MNFIIMYSISYIMDLIFGDPLWFPHPVRFIGGLISFLEKYLYKYKHKTFFGGITAITTVVITTIIAYYIASISIYLQIFFLWTTLATKCLADEVLKVYKVLEKKDLELAKKQLSYLVSRDTEVMDEQTVIRGTLETLSENFSDGVITPMFYAFLGSFFYYKGVNLALPFAFTFKAASTLDSMIGYKNDKYMNFGTVGAKLDDVFNFIPARITGLIFIPLSSFLLGYDYKNSLRIFLRDRKNHASPNSGHCYSAFAGALHLQFGGKTKYFGIVFDKPTLGDKTKDFELSDILKGRRLLYMTSFVGLIMFSIIYILF